MRPTLRALVVVVALLVTTTPAVAGTPSPDTSSGRIVHLAHPKVIGGLLATGEAAPGDAPSPEVLAAAGAAGPAAVSPLHPDGTLRYVVADGLHARRGLLRIVTTDSRKPTVVTEIPLSPGLSPRDIALDTERGRLYLASGTHTEVLDLAVPAVPRIVARIADVMIAAHDHIQLQTVPDPTFGWRTFLAITTDFVGGEGCRLGTLYVLDITGRLQDAPIEILETSVPAAAHGGGCPQPSVRLDAPQRRLAVDWVVGDEEPLRSDSAPYDITSAFQASADVCRLVRV